MSAARARRILFTVMPYEGEVRDRVTAKFYKNSAVKYMPLGVLSIGACVPEGYEFAVLDAASRNLTLDETIAEIEAFAPDVLGLSVVTYRAWAMVQILERTSAPIKVVGGPHTKYNHEAIRRQGAHAVFVDDAEVTFPQWLADGCPEGTFFGGSVELDSLPLPARNLLDLDDYRIEYNDDLLFRVGNLRLPMYSSKGCPFACICRALVENEIDVDWSARGTIEVRESVVAELAAAGCKRLHVGIESLDDETLIYFKKSSRFKHIQRFAELCNRYGITILGYFIIGAPTETEQYRRDLPKMIEDLGIRLPYFNLLTPLAETPYYFEQLANGNLDRDYWKEFCDGPVRDFEIPDSRPLDEELELRAVIDSYVDHFKRFDMPVFVS